jgi:hypothetical protein
VPLAPAQRLDPRGCAEGDDVHQGGEGRNRLGEGCRLSDASGAAQAREVGRLHLPRREQGQHQLAVTCRASKSRVVRFRASR